MTLWRGVFVLVLCVAGAACCFWAGRLFLRQVTRDIPMRTECRNRTGTFFAGGDRPTQDPNTSLVETRSCRVNVLDLGSGDVVVRVHGSGRSIADWQEGFAESLAQRFRVIAFDNYGFGRSDRSARSGRVGSPRTARSSRNATASAWKSPFVFAERAPRS